MSCNGPSVIAVAAGRIGWSALVLATFIDAGLCADESDTKGAKGSGHAPRGSSTSTGATLNLKTTSDVLLGKDMDVPEDRAERYVLDA